MSNQLHRLVMEKTKWGEERRRMDAEIRILRQALDAIEASGSTTVIDGQTIADFARDVLERARL